MSECKCGAFQKFQGSGCRYCNPQDTIKQLQQQNAELMEIAKAVAHIGIDFSYGVYELEQCFIDSARKIYEAKQEG